MDSPAAPSPGPRRVVAVIQARMSSTRLPGKVLAPIAGQPMVLRVLTRAARIPGVDAAVLATSDDPSDDHLAAAVVAAGWRVHRGPLEDVRARFLMAIAAEGADAAVRITADCPLICPEVSGRVVAVLRGGGLDYVSNVLHRTWPRGLDTEAFTAAALAGAAAISDLPRDREHVTTALWMHPGRVRLCGVHDGIDRSAWRWTVDTPEDLDLVRRLVAAAGPDAGYADLAAAMAADPALAQVNAAVAQKPVM